MKLQVSLCVLASLLFSALTKADLPGSWPPVDKPPPPVASWTALVDSSKVPKAPVAKDAGANCPDNDQFCNWSCTLCTRADSDIVTCPTKGDWGISFDDGPTEFTPPLLDYLDSTGIKVTFFAIGSRVIENPETLQRAVKAGHQVGVHTWSHTALTTQTDEEIIAEIKWTEEAIKQAVGLTPKYMRPPFGDYDDRVRSIMTQLGYKIVIWDYDTNDWMSGEDPKFQVSWIEGNFTEWVKTPSDTGHISLEHDLYKPSAEQGPKAIEIVKGAGFTIKPVAICMGDTQPYVEGAGNVGGGGAAGGANGTTDAGGNGGGAAGGGAAAGGAAAGGDGGAAGTPAIAAATPTSASNYLAAGDTTPVMASASSTMASMPNNASLNNINLSFVFLIIGLLTFFKL